MRLLVTGAAGFIGSQLTLHLERCGHCVLAMDDFSTGHLANLSGFNGEFSRKDIASASPIEIDGTLDVIFHQAAITDPRYPDRDDLIRKNLRGFDQVSNLAERKKAKLVFASSAGVYGNGPVPMVESQLPDITTAYAESKLLIDRIALGRGSDGVGPVGLRYFNVFGPGESYKGRPASMIYHLARMMKRGERPQIFEWGEQVRDFIYVKDVVQANLLALSAPPGIYNVGTGIGTSFNELVEVLNLELGTNLPPVYIPMPFDPATYQSNTIADCSQSVTHLKFEAQWGLRDAIVDYLPSLFV